MVANAFYNHYSSPGFVLNYIAYLNFIRHFVAPKGDIMPNEDQFQAGGSVRHKTGKTVMRICSSPVEAVHVEWTDESGETHIDLYAITSLIYEPQPVVAT